jgi:hypothetical protein
MFPFVWFGYWASATLLAAWVCEDARRHDFRGSRIARTRRGWMFGAWILLPVFVPLYLRERGRAPRTGALPPLQPTVRWWRKHDRFEWIASAVVTGPALTVVILADTRDRPLGWAVVPMVAAFAPQVRALIAGALRERARR